MDENIDDKIKIEYIQLLDETVIQQPVRKTKIVTESEFKSSEGYQFETEIKIEETTILPRNERSPSTRSILSSTPITPNYTPCSSNVKFKCLICKYKTNNRINLKKHSICHARVKNFKCSECSKMFYTKPELTRHMKLSMKIDAGITYFTCRNKTSIPRFTSYECEKCGYKTQQRHHLVVHLLAHADLRNLQCKECPKRFSAQSSLNSHMKTHLALKPYQCDVCLKFFSQKHNLLQHLRTHLPKEPIITYECYICGDAVKYQRINYLKRHMQLHIGKNEIEKMLSCNKCSERFSHRNYLNRHMKVKHNQPIETDNTAKRYQCSMCQYSSNYNNHLKTHILTHTGEKPYLCYLCPKKYGSSSHLKRHLRTGHISDKLFKCNKCTKEYNDKGSLNKHIRRVHMGEEQPKKFKCNICSLATASKSNLRNHLRIHSGEKPFQCKVCLHSFALKSNLDRHSNGAKCHQIPKFKYECKICSKNFLHKYTFKSHLRLHEIDKYECYICGYAPKLTTQSIRKLRMHMRQQHSEGQRSVIEKCKRLSDRKLLNTKIKSLECCLCTFKSAAVNSLVDHMKIHGVSVNCSVNLTKM